MINYNNKKTVKVLTIGDAHISKNDNLIRFNRLVRYIKRNKILLDYIVIIGDFGDFDCLSSWEKNKRELLDNSYLKDEINKINEALDILMKLKVKIIYIKGNHEHRLNKYIDNHKTLNGLINLELLLNFKNRNIDYIEYKDQVIINKVSFTHVPISGNGQPINGINITKRALSIFGNSVIFGHTHKLRFEHETKINTGTHYALNVGCFFEDNPDYLEGSANDIWKGVILLDIYKNGNFDYKAINIDNIK